jgi:hypothetical protein
MSESENSNYKKISVSRWLKYERSEKQIPHAGEPGGEAHVLIDMRTVYSILVFLPPSASYICAFFIEII